MPRDSGSACLSEILAGLHGPRPDLAWRKFLDRYAGLILAISRQYTLDEDRANDCFLSVCAALCEGRGRRLSYFNSERGASFETWLTAVVANLCADWHRATFGRRVLPSAVKKLGPLEQCLYRLHFEQALDLQSCLHFAKVRFPDLDPAGVTETLRTLHRAMTPRQRWAAGVRRSRGKNDANTPDADSLPAPSLGPDEWTEAHHRRAGVLAALDRLPASQKLVLRLRFEQDLSLEQVARAAGLHDLHQARRVIEAALSALRDALVDPDDSP